MKNYVFFVQINLNFCSNKFKKSTFFFLNLEQYKFHNYDIKK